MGQTTSSERQTQVRSTLGPSNAAQIYQTLEDGRRSESQEQEALLSPGEDRRRSGIRSGVGGLARLASGRSRQQEDSSTYRRETRARSTLITGNMSAGNGDTHGRDDVVLEQEERPLIMRDMERLNDSPITDIRAAPMPRRASVLQRFGSRVRSSRGTDTVGPTRDSEMQQDGPTQPAILGNAQQTSRTARTRRNRLSMFEISSRSAADVDDTVPRRNSLSAAMFPTSAEPPDGLETLAEGGTSRGHLSQSGLPEPPHMPRLPRGTRLRRSLFRPFGHIFGRDQPRSQQGRNNASYSAPQAGTDETRNLISPQGTGTTVADPGISTTHFDGTEEGTSSAPAELDSPDRPQSWLPRFRETNNTRDDSSGAQNILGGRSSRLIRREDDTPLSRVLQLAAAAIARQLSGTNDPTPDLQSVGDDHFDGNLNDFIRTLNSAAERSVTEDATSNNSTLPPLNFWRVFRFVNQNSNSTSGLNQHPPSIPDGSPNRLVTLVVVGVRSVPSSSVLSETAGTLNTNLDDLMALPPTPSDAIISDARAISEATERTRNRLQRRRTSLTGTNPFPSQYESQRHQGMSSSRLNRTTGVNPLRRTSTHSSSPYYATRPPSPFPTTDPPTTPLSRMPTYNATRPSPGESSSSSTLRQRRRSESLGNLGSGAARRNGVVEPDSDAGDGPPASSNSRHWLIYVVGTNLSEDHPAFSAPSLFTDNPSYEDMVMLSTLLGPVKPPVATNEDVAAALGVYRLELRRADGSWTARVMDRQQGVGHGVASPLEVLNAAEVVKCLVCQDEFDQGDEVRRLAKCRHVFHKLCVDQWLTTGRNSCPTCRTTGVEEVTAAS